MIGDHKKWLLYLQEKGIKFENVSVNETIWHTGEWEFKNDPKDYRIPDQPIPDIPDWRELCREMQSKGVEFENSSALGNSWVKCSSLVFDTDIKYYRIPQQPIPEWSNEEMNQKELYIQYLEDALNHEKTGEPMKHWQMKCNDGTWENLSRYLYVSRDEYLELRIKPEPFKWTTFVCKTVFGNLHSGGLNGELSKTQVGEMLNLSENYILAIHHHEIEIE